MLKALLPADGQVTRASCGHVVSGEKKDFLAGSRGHECPPLTPKAGK